MEERPNLPQNFHVEERERVENLQQRYIRIQKRVESLRNQSNFSQQNTEQILENIDRMLKQLRDYEEQIRSNALQPISEYERLIPDCQVDSRKDQNTDENNS